MRSEECAVLRAQFVISFVFCGAQVTLKLGGEDYASFSYILFPLKTGLLVLPRLLVDYAHSDSPLPLIRDTPTHAFVPVSKL
jgi:hypothetical protein